MVPGPPWVAKLAGPSRSNRQRPSALTPAVRYALDDLYSGPLPDNAPAPHRHGQGHSISDHSCSESSLWQPWPIAYSITRPWLESQGCLMPHRLLSAIATRSHGGGLSCLGAAFRSHCSLDCLACLQPRSRDLAHLCRLCGLSCLGRGCLELL